MISSNAFLWSAYQPAMLGLKGGSVHVEAQVLVPTLIVLVLVTLLIRPRLKQHRMTATDADRNAWWSAQHYRYNWLLILSIAASLVMLAGVAWVFGSDLPCFRYGGFDIAVWILVLPVLYAAANGWYFLSSFVEWLLRPGDPRVFSRRMLRAGLIVSTVLFFLPVIVTATAALLNLPCMTKPGQTNPSALDLIPGAAAAPTRDS